MNLSRKFIMRFAGYFILFYALLTIVIMVIFFTALMKDSDKLMYEDVRKESTNSMLMYIKDDNGKLTPKKSLLTHVKKQKGILLIEDKGDIVYQSDPKFKFKGLYAYNEEDFTTWKIGEYRNVIFIDRKPLAVARMKFETDAEDKVDYLKKNHFSLFVKEKDGFRQKYGSMNELRFNREIMHHRNDDGYQKFFYKTFEDRDKTYYVVKENPKPMNELAIYGEDSYKYDEIFMNAMKGFLKWYLLLNICIILVIILIAALMGRQLARPLLHFIRWVEALGEGKFYVPENKSLYKRGRLRRQYRMFTPIDNAIAKLTRKLSDDEAYRNKISDLRQDWIRGITHDIKTPLSSIYGYSSLMTSDIDLTPEDRAKFAGIIENKAMYIDQLLKDLNMTYQMKNDVIEYQKQLVNINDYISDFVSNYNNDHLQYINQTDVEVMIDKERMTRVFNNIVSNSFTHNEDVHVWINTIVQNNKVNIEISDNGQGIHEDDLPNIFTQFYRGSNTNQHHNGSGLGLAVAKQIVTNHDGTIEVFSSDAGTKFIISLPLAKE